MIHKFKAILGNILIDSDLKFSLSDTVNLCLKKQRMKENKKWKVERKERGAERAVK